MTVKISALPTAATPLAGTELVEIVKGGVSSKTTVADITPATGYQGTWTPGTFNSGAIVRRGPFSFGAIADTTVDPCIVEGNLGNVADWNVLGDASQSGDILTLVNTTGEESASLRLSVNTAWTNKRLMVDALVGPTGGADAFTFGIYDSSLTTTPTPSSGLGGVTGFWGVNIDYFNDKVQTVINGVKGNDVSANIFTTDQAEGNANLEVDFFYRYYLDMVENGANWDLALYREHFNRNGAIGVNEPGLITTWSVTKPTFTSWRFGVGGHSGGIAGTVRVKHAFVQDKTDWELISVLPHMPSIDIGAF